MLETKLGIEGRNIRISGTPPPTPGWKMKSFRMQKGIPNLKQFLDFLGGHPVHSKDDSNSGHMRVNTTLIHCPELFRSKVPARCIGWRRIYYAWTQRVQSWRALQAPWWAFSFLLWYGMRAGAHAPSTSWFSKLPFSHPSSFNSGLPVFHRDILVPPFLSLPPSPAPPPPIQACKFFPNPA